MARLSKVSITLCALLFTLPFISLTHASEQARSVESLKKSSAKKAKKSTDSDTGKKKNHESKKKSQSTEKSVSKSGKNKTDSAKKAGKEKAASKKPVKSSTKKLTATEKKAVAKKSSSKTVSKNSKPSAKKSDVKTKSALKNAKSDRHSGHSASTFSPEHEVCVNSLTGHKKRCKAEGKDLTIAQAHKIRVQKAKQTAVTNLMKQLGKPYRWGGSSPHTGFDCSGLVYYVYKDLVNIQIPRTANEMYHLRDAAPVQRGQLEKGDLVFFRTRGRGVADHVGVYVGNGKFIQSPSTGKDIRITSLSDSYWQRHYVGARRVMTAKNIR